MTLNNVDSLIKKYKENHNEDSRDTVDAVAMVRVSTKEPKEGFSLDAQKDNIYEYALKQGLNIVKLWETLQT